MPNASYDLSGTTPEVQIGRCRGDLNVEGHDAPDVRISSPSLPEVSPGTGRLSILDSPEDLRVWVPVGASVRVERVEGDARLVDLSSLELDEVSGDLRLDRIVGSCRVRKVEGDVRASRISELSLEKVIGDAALEVTGTLVLGRVGGDAVVNGTVRGMGRTKIDGDLALKGTVVPEGEYEVVVDGDAALHLGSGTDLTLSAKVDGDVVGLRRTQERRVYEQTYGSGQGRMTLEVRGDLVATGGGPAGLLHAAVASFVPAPPSPPAPRATPVSRTTSSQEQGPEQERRSRGSTTLPDREVMPEQDPSLEVLEALARGELTPEEAERRLADR